MKIICVGQNYQAHNKEMGSKAPKEPVFFMKPETAIVQKHLPFFYPDFSNEIHYEVELVLRICKVGKNIQASFADSYYDAIGIGIDFTARDLQRKCKEFGLPWECAKSFDNSAAVGDVFLPKAALGNLKNINFSLKQNGRMVQSGNSVDMIFDFNEIIAYISKFVTLKIGDLIFTGTPEGVGAVALDDVLEAYVGDKKMLEIKVK